MRMTTRVRKHFSHRPLAIAAAIALLVGASLPARAQSVSASGDVAPVIVTAPVVDLTGQRINVGLTTAGVGTLGSLSITGGGSLTAAHLAVGNGGLGVGTVSVSGTGSVINLTGGNPAFNKLEVGGWGTGTLTVSNGGLVACSSSLACPFSQIGNGAGSTGTLAINGGTVSGLGVFDVGSGSLQAGFGTPGAATTATLTITNGGLLASTGSSSVAINRGQTGLVTGNVTIDGAGSQWAITRDLANGGGQAFLNLAPTANSVANVTISNGGNLTVIGSRSSPATDNSIPGIQLSPGAGGTSTMTVTTGGSVRIGGDSGILIVGGSTSVNSAGATANLNITAGGTVSGTGPNGLTFFVIGRNQASGTVNVSGAGSQLVVAGVGGTNTQGLDGVGGILDVGRTQSFGGGTGTLNVTGGGSVLISDNGQAATNGGVRLRVGNGAGSSGSVLVSGPGSSIVVSSTGGGSVVPSVRIGEGGGSGTLNMSGGSTITFTGAATGATLRVGGQSGSGVMTMTGSSIVNTGATGSVQVGSSTGSTGSLTIGGGSRVFGNTAGIGGSSDTAAGGVGSVLVTGAGSQLSVAGESGFIGVGRSGTGSLTVSSQGEVAATILNVGRAAGGVGTLSVDNGIINLSGQQASGFGAGLSIGNRGGTGTASITNGSVVTIANAGSGGANLNVGGTPTNPLGTGTLTVSNSTINLIAAPGQAVARIGHDGSGTATFTNSALNVGDGTLIIAGQPGSTGTLTLSAGSVVNANYVGVGATPSGLPPGTFSPQNPAGAGTLVINNSTVNAISTFEIGALGVLTGNNGVINVRNGDVIVGGTISPGESPGRIRINCNLVSLDGSKLILEVQDNGSGGYNIDQLVIGNDSTFDLAQFEIVFSFLGNTNPTAFAESGGFDLDNFLLSGSFTGGDDVGLSTRFAELNIGNWGDAVDLGRISAVSNVFDISSLSFDADSGSVGVIATQIPEPSTWSLILLGFVLVAAARARKLRRGPSALAPQGRVTACS